MDNLNGSIKRFPSNHRQTSRPNLLFVGVECKARTSGGGGGGWGGRGMSARASGVAVAPGPDPRRLSTNRGEQAERKPVTVEKTLGRNDPCHCGSGKKYKKCHGR